MVSILDETLQQTIHHMPKIELHRHLEGSLRLATLVEIGQQYGMEISDVDTLRPFVQMMPNEPRNASRFLSKFYRLRQFYRTEAIVERLVREVIADAAADNICYMELRFTPRALCNLIGCDLADMVGLVCRVGSDAAAQHGIRVRYIVSVNRHEPVELSEGALRGALRHRDMGIVALDLAGDEANFPAAPFREVFARARAEGLHVTVHAGEWAGVHSIRSAIEELGARRIGHGLNVRQDERLIDSIIHEGIALELCPTSNVLSGIVDTFADHPIHWLTTQGVATTLNTDDPLVCDVTLTQEMLNMVRAFHLSLADVRAYMLRAARAAFLTESERADLQRTLTQYNLQAS